VNGRRKALIVANDQYENEGLRQLLSPAADADALGTVLRDPRIGGFDVQVVRNEPAHVISTHIEDLFSEGRPDDVLVVHFSCHGLKSESGELFFAARNTRPNRLGSTALSADFVQRCMRASRSRSVVLLLDCCYGGAFSQGVRVRAAGDVNVLDSFPGGKLGGGRGRAVITASSAMEYAFEGDHLADDQSRRPSVFTSALVEGLATGDADRDQDGWVSLNELYEYVFDRVREQNPNQTPSRDVEMQGDLYLARRSRPVTAPAPLPRELQEVIEHPLANIRAGAVQELARLERGRHAGQAIAAKLALERLANDDSRTVAAAAAAALAAIDRDLGTKSVGTKPAGGAGPTSAFAGQDQPTDEDRRSTDAMGRPPAVEPAATALAPTSAVPTSPDATARVASPPGHLETPLDARRHGYADGAAAARDIPLYAFEGLFATGFDVVRWLEPWREAWRLIATGEAPPDANLLRWLPPLAQFLGPYAAPAQLLQASIKPSTGYVAGFVDAFGETWHAAVKDGLLPANPATLSAWLREPTTPGQPSDKPRALLTINDLQMSARKARRINALRLTGRIALWILIALFALTEIGMIGVTIAGDLEPNTASTAVSANLCVAIPLVGLATWGYFDIRRHRKRRQVGVAEGSVVQAPDEAPQ
jgi:hypothetical protein